MRVPPWVELERGRHQAVEGHEPVVDVPLLTYAETVEALGFDPGETPPEKHLTK